eukprot:jgi/Tetstr1/450013/TSEL_037060.t1
MSLKVSASDGVKVYNVSTSKKLPDWLSNKKKRSLRKDEEFRRRVELVQDLSFPSACTTLKASQDGEYLFAAGLHAPQIRCYELSQLSMKFSRHMDSEIVDFQVLSEDWQKLAIICQDRTVNLHSRFGHHYRTRIPKVGRSVAYFPTTADLVIGGSSQDIYRLNLSEGRFLAPLQCSSPAVNSVRVSPTHGLLAAAGDGGLLECFDLRMRKCAGTLDVADQVDGARRLTTVRFDSTGLKVAAGTDNGMVVLYDLRSSRPLQTKDHMYGFPIKDIKFHQGGLAGGGTERVISADKRIVKVWDQDSGAQYTSIEPSDGDINDICVFRNSGLIFAGCDAKRVEAYFVPTLGPAPRWCSFLEGLTEELEENDTPTIYDDYRFVTKAELAKLGLHHLLGTQMLRSYMHGYFIDNRLYHKAKNIADPFAYSTYRAKRIEEKLESERKSRITVRAKLPKVNALAAARFIQQDGPPRGADEEEGGGGGKRRKAANPMADDRFKVMFEDKAFQIDEKSDEYRILHPNHDSNKRDSALLKEHFEQLDEEEEGGEEEGEEEESDALSDPEGVDSDSDGDGGGRRARPRKAARQAPRMFAAKDEVSATAFKRKHSVTGLAQVPFAQRMASGSGGDSAHRQVGGAKELSFRPQGGRGSRAPSGAPGGSGGGGRGRGGGGGGRRGGRGGGGRGGGGRGGGGRGGRGGGRGGRGGGRR